MTKKVLKIHEKDNVIVALQDLKKDEIIRFEQSSIALQSDVPAKHKFVISDLNEGDKIIMYGVVVGKTLSKILSGTPITTSNVVHETGDLGLVSGTYHWDKPDTERWKNRTFLGYHRDDGKVGVTNYWLVIPLVFCENRNIDVIKESMLTQLGYGYENHRIVDIEPLIQAVRDGKKSEEIVNIPLTRGSSSKNLRVFKHVDGIKFLTHQMGCGGSRGDAKLLCELLAGYIDNPNVAGATVLSLGCQNAEQSLLESALAKRDPKRLKPVFFHEQQLSKSEEDFITEVIKSTFIGLAQADKMVRSSAPISKLVLGLECGGSDGFSGISANPALGYASDIINALGGTTILSEFPELHGIEHELVHRCVNSDIAGKFMKLMQAYSEKAKQSGFGFEANPSPGNIKDGLITDAMKSAGAAKKGGTAPISAVLDYTEPIVIKGLNLLCTPGNDVESTTGLAGSGANIIVFTTGLGTPTGNPIAPVIKVSSNTNLFNKMRDIIDVNAGDVISGEGDIKSVGEEIMEYILKVAGGEVNTKAQDLGQDDFIPWKRDISL